MVGGTLLAFATILKLFPAVLVVVLVLQRRLRALLAFVVGLVCFVLLGFLGGGPQRTVEWAGQIFPRYAGGFGTPNNQSLEGAIYCLFRPIAVDRVPLFGRPSAAVLQPLIDNERMGIVLGYVLGGMVVLVSLWLVGRQWRQQLAGIELPASALLLITVLLVMPLVWYHYYTLLLIAYGIGIPYAQRERSFRLLLFISSIFIAFQRYWRITANLDTPLLVSFGTLGVGLLWVAFARTVYAGNPVQGVKSEAVSR